MGQLKSVTEQQCRYWHLNWGSALGRINFNGEKHMNTRKLLTLMCVCGLSAGGHRSTHATDAASAQQYDPKTLAKVEALYGLSEDAAVSRLAREYEAAIQARRIEERNLSSFAGAWFDSATQRLHIAVSSKTDFSAIEQVGAIPVLVNHNLAELEAMRNSTVDSFNSELGNRNVRSSYVDVRANAVVVGISEAAMKQASSLMTARSPASVPVQLSLVANEAVFSTDLHGADGTQNATWFGMDGHVHPCSVGASAEKVSGTTYVLGFATAGHCNALGNSIQSSGGTSLGTVAQSTYSIANGGTFSNHEDGAWVSTLASWVPRAQVNGYTDGILNVSGTWAGTLDAPVGTTVCRYGSASSGPHCAPVTARNVNAVFQLSPTKTVTINGLIKVNGICTNDGDSGGSLITPSNQVQGTNSGGEIGSSCPDSSGDVDYFQPIATTLARATSALSSDAVAMLTSHGRSAPTMPAFVCPDPANSGEHIYECNIPSFDSQGKTDILWTTNTYIVPPATTTNLSGTCTTGQIVTVALAVTNPYGTTTKNYSFLCPINPLP